LNTTLKEGFEMKKRNLFSLITALILTLTGCSTSTVTGVRDAASNQAPFAGLRGPAAEDLEVPWAYDGGPSAETAMGRELIDLVATQPNMPDISLGMTGGQKFRPAFGPTLWRMIQHPNTVKILFIGQDGTHIAEAAGRTATAGFGGRAQDLAAYFGVRTGAAFMNTFAFTIKGQYSAFNTPILSEDQGKKRVVFGSVVENGVWLMAQDQASPMVKWRNGLIDWIIRNNQKSLKMVVLFGGSAQDSIATFIESKGGKVGARYSSEDLAKLNIKIPVFKMQPAGGNNEYPAVLDKNDELYYPKLLGRTLDYSKLEDQAAIQKAMTQNPDKAFADLAISNTGVGGSGVLHPVRLAAMT